MALANFILVTAVMQLMAMTLMFVDNLDTMRVVVHHSVMVESRQLIAVGLQSGHM